MRKSFELHHDRTKLTPHSEAFDELGTIDVGEGDDKRTFQAFKGVLAFYSGYFDGAFNGRFVEARAGAVKLPTEDPLIFEIFLHWTNTRRFYESTLDPAVLLSFDTIAALWIFGDAHEIPMLQNEVVDVFVLKLRGTMIRPERETIDFIWENTPEGSALQRLVIDFVSMLIESKMPTVERERCWRFERSGAARAASTAWYVEGETDANDFLHQRPPLNPKPRQWQAYGVSRCRWHAHGDGEKCGEDSQEGVSATQWVICMPVVID